MCAPGDDATRGAASGARAAARGAGGPRRRRWSRSASGRRGEAVHPEGALDVDRDRTDVARREEARELHLGVRDVASPHVLVRGGGQTRPFTAQGRELLRARFPRRELVVGGPQWLPDILGHAHVEQVQLDALLRPSGPYELKARLPSLATRELHMDEQEPGTPQVERELSLDLGLLVVERRRPSVREPAQ